MNLEPMLKSIKPKKKKKREKRKKKVLRVILLKNSWLNQFSVSV